MGVNGENTLPDGWEVVPLGKIAKVLPGGTPSRAVPTYWGGKIPWFGTGRIDFNTINTTDETITEEGLAASAAKVFPAGTVVLALIGQGATRGKVARLGLDAAFNQNCVAIVPSDGDCPEFLFHSLAARYAEIRGTGNSSGVSSLNASLIKQLPVVRPTRGHQEYIARCMACWQDGIEQTTRLLIAKRRMRAGIVTRLLERDGQPTRLGDVVEESRLRNNALALGQDTVRAVNKVEGMIPMKENVIGSSLDRYKVVRKDWFAYNPMRLNIGSIARWREDRDVLVSPDYVVLRCRDGLLDPDYLDHLRRSPRWVRFVEEAGNGSVRVRIYYADLARLQLPLPPIAEQRRIAAVLNTLDREIALLRDYFDALKKQKRGLMQLLLTGKLRVRP